MSGEPIPVRTLKELGKHCAELAMPYTRFSAERVGESEYYCVEDETTYAKETADALAEEINRRLTAFPALQAEVEGLRGGR